MGIFKTPAKFFLVGIEEDGKGDTNIIILGELE